MPRQQGFTLLELLVVLLIMGLMLTLAPPVFERVMPGVGLKSAAREIAGGLREARGVAIRDNRDIALIVDTEKKAFSLAGDPRVHELDPDLAVRLTTAASERTGETAAGIRFFPDGTSTGGRVSLSRNERTYHVVVDWLTGRIEIVE